MTPAVMEEAPSRLKSMVDLNTGLFVARRLTVAATFSQRFFGLMGRRRLDESEGLLLKGCRSIHTCFLRFPIDVAYLDRDMCVLAVHSSVRPWRFLPGAPLTEHTLEVPAGTLNRTGVRVGHRLMTTTPRS